LRSRHRGPASNTAFGTSPSSLQGSGFGYNANDRIDFPDVVRLFNAL